MTLQKKRGRNPVEQDKIAAYVRKKIISGKWPIGYKIPTRLELVKEFGVTVVTVQRALTSLISDGFLRVDMSGNRGTYVREDLPFLFNYALVFSCEPSADHGTNIFYTTLFEVSKSIQNEEGIKIRHYVNVDGNRMRPDYLQLLDDFRKERLAGIIFASNVYMIETTPVVNEGNIPRIVIGGDNRADLPTISLDESTFIDKCLDYLQSKNRHRIALLSTANHRGKFTENIKSAFAKRNLAFIPEWHQFCHLHYVEAATNIVHLLMSLPKQERPDAILVSNDNLIYPVCEGLKLAKVKVPEDLEIVSHSNFPRLSMPDLPVKFIGYNINALLSRCIEMLKQSKTSVKIPSETVIKACTYEEYSDKQSL